MGPRTEEDSPLGPYPAEAACPIIGRGIAEALLTDEISILCDEIRALLDHPVSGEERPTLEHLEHTLTEGYARALALEAERWRLERRINEVAGELCTSDGNGRTDELAVLAARLSRTSGSLDGLRGLLAELRARTDEVRELTLRSAS